MKNIFLILSGVICLGLSSLYAQNSGNDNYPKQNDYEIFLPGTLINSLPFELVTTPGSNQKLKKFRAKYGNWSFLIDKQTRIIHRAFGQGIKLPGLDIVNKQTIQTAAINFFESNRDIFGIDINSLKLVRTTNINGRWYLSYKQYYKNIEVVLSEIELRIFQNGKMSDFSLIYYPVKDLDLNQSILSRQEAAQFSTIGIPFEPLTGTRTVSKDLLILPYTVNSKTSYKLVYKIDIETANPPAHYFSYLDAHTGKTLWRQNMIMNVNKFTSEGLVKMRFANDTFQMQPFANMQISIDGKINSTNKNGNIDIDLNDTTTFNAKFKGKWAIVKLRKAPRNTADFTSKIPPRKNYYLTWTDSISLKTERILFYHANIMHDYIRQLDTSLKDLDFQLQITVDFSGSSPNASSGGSSIFFIAVGISSMRMAESPQVLYHEYGHTVNFYLYSSQGASSMLNLSCNEGTADLFSTMIQDEPKMGIGVWVNQPNKIIRTLDNTLKYPQDIKADAHYNGQILGGAFWDLRKLTSLDFARKLSHFTKYGTPDDPNIGKAFSEWFLEALNTDDDDGDLSNGTPHIIEIIKAFNLHNIGTNLFLQYGFNHEQLPNTLETKTPYIVEFKLQSLPITNGTPDSVLVIWTNDDFQTTQATAATLKNAQTGLYQASIPAQPAGSVIRYYMHAWDPLSKSPIDFYKNPASLRPYIFLVGFQSVYFDNFENSDWTVGSKYDNATQGFWENAIPKSVDLTPYGLDVIQPGTDFSNVGMKCWVTDQRNNLSTFQQYMPNGRTTLTSVEYDLNTYSMPIIRYQKWFYNLYGSPIPGRETYWKTNLSFDGGNTWLNIKKTKIPTDKWEATYIELYKYIPDTANKFKIQFVFDAQYSQSQLISINEGLIDDFEILDIDPNFVNVGTEKNQNTFITTYPNPFTNKIHFSINSATQRVLKIDIYDILGQKVNTLLSHNNSTTGTIDWFGTDFNGKQLNKGIYIYKVLCGKRIYSGKIIKM